jgi:hypothetical protein
LAADRLAGLLRQAGVRVAVLGACESGRRDRVSPWAGVAPALVADQVAAIVAMQYRVRDSYAIKFARAFYTALAVGLSVDEAVSAGRLAVYDEDDMSRSWGVPVLYMRSPDGVVFPRISERASGSADAFRTAVRQVVGTIDKGGKVVGIKIVRSAGGAATIEVSQEARVVRDELVGIENLDLSGGRSYRPNDGD